MNIQKVGVIGAGVMGSSTALSLALTGHRVVLIDISAEILKESENKITNEFRVCKILSSGKFVEDIGDILPRINFSVDLELLKTVDFVIENSTEKFGIKKSIYEKIDSICTDSCIFAANTSAIPITRLASLTARPKQMIGLHFMNPVVLKPTVEVIRGFHTSDETLAQALKLLKQMNKNGIVVNDSPGFVTNRVLMLTINEAIFLLHEQVATAKDIDLLFKQCFGHKMGPLETADLIGLDTVLLSLEVLYDNFKDSKFRPCPLLCKMVDAGFWGRKNGKGFFNYNAVVVNSVF